MEPVAFQAALEVAKGLQQAAARRSQQRPVVAEGLDENTTVLFDALVTDSELREETRQLFVDGHYAQAVEEGYKYLNNIVKRRTGLVADGAGLMTTAFSPSKPLLRLNRLKTQSQLDQQQGYMQIFAGVMTGVRNPRAHEHKHLDNPRSAIELLTLCNHLVRVAAAATRTRSRKT